MVVELKEFSLEDAIKWFKENPFYHKDHIPFNMAIKALEKQMPQKPIIENGMVKLPDHCYDCPCHNGESGYCQADKDHRYSDYRPFWCPLEETREESKIGHWVEEIIDKWGLKVFCSECGCSPPFEYVSDGDVYSPSSYGVINKTKFCPNCGARMIDPKERSEE